MTVPELPAEARRQAESSVAGSTAELLERLAERLGGKASVTAVFGEPVVCEGVTIVPVARAGFGLGAGTGRDRESAQGGGGGGGAWAAPLGYIEIKDGEAVFRPTRDPLMRVLAPLAAVGAVSLGLRAVRVLVRRRRPC